MRTGPILFVSICLVLYHAASVKIALVQTGGSPLNNPSVPSGDDVSRNLQYLNESCIKAAQQGAEIAVFPELFLTGYNIGPLFSQVAESATGTSFQFVSKVAQANQLAIVYGFPQKKGKKIYNSANVVSKNGDLILTYQKTHLFSSERNNFQAGNKLGPVITLAGLKIAVLICYDVEFPEATRLLRLAGAQLVLAPSANMKPYFFVTRQIVPVRALENNFGVIYVNRVGLEDWTAAPGPLDFFGESVAADPFGEVLVKLPLDEPALVVTDFNPSNYTYEDDWSYTVDRRPELYSPVCSQLNRVDYYVAKVTREYSPRLRSTIDSAHHDTEEKV